MLGDLHAAPNDHQRIKKIVQKVLLQNPDVVVMVGDFVNGHKEKHAMALSELTSLLQPLTEKYPCYAVLGNHDLYYGAEKIRRYFEKIGVIFLEREKVKIRNSQGSALTLAGFDHVETRQIYSAVPSKEIVDVSPMSPFNSFS